MIWNRKIRQRDRIHSLRCMDSAFQGGRSTGYHTRSTSSSWFLVLVLGVQHFMYSCTVSTVCSTRGQLLLKKDGFELALYFMMFSSIRRSRNICFRTSFSFMFKDFFQNRFFFSACHDVITLDINRNWKRDEQNKSIDSYASSIYIHRNPGRKSK